MSVRPAVLVLAALAACRPGSSPVPEAKADEPSAPAGGGVAVVELFTSEGCSSCPPADAVLADLARPSDRAVYALAFHVDYWDDLGWPDRFASAANTARQRAYARTFGARGVYTPQMIVDGTEELTGSDREHATAAIARALAAPASVALTLRLGRDAAGAISVDYEARGAAPSSVINVALVERAAVSAVAAGENAGRTLHHANVVRTFVTSPAAPTGSVRLQVPAGLRPEDADVIAFVQGTFGNGRMPVLGAARASLQRP